MEAAGIQSQQERSFNGALPVQVQLEHFGRFVAAHPFQSGFVIGGISYSIASAQQHVGSGTTVGLACIRWIEEQERSRDAEKLSCDAACKTPPTSDPAILYNIMYGVAGYVHQKLRGGGK